MFYHSNSIHLFYFIVESFFQCWLGTFSKLIVFFSQNLHHNLCASNMWYFWYFLVAIFNIDNLKVKFSMNLLGKWNAPSNKNHFLWLKSQTCKKYIYKLLQDKHTQSRLLLLIVPMQQLSGFSFLFYNDYMYIFLECLCF